MTKCSLSFIIHAIWWHYLTSTLLIGGKYQLWPSISGNIDSTIVGFLLISLYTTSKTFSYSMVIMSTCLDDVMWYYIQTNKNFVELPQPLHHIDILWGPIPILHMSSSRRKEVGLIKTSLTRICLQFDIIDKQDLKDIKKK